MRTLQSALIAIVLTQMVAAAAATPRWFITLFDGSRIAFSPKAEALEFESEVLGSVIEVQVESIRGAELDGAEKLRLELANGDRISGTLAGGKLVGDTVFGSLEIERRHIERLEVVVAPPLGEFQVDHAGLRWDLWRTGWAIEAGKLVAQRGVRPGFRYGHWANGRGGMAITGNGDPDWTDYEVAFDYKMLAANREFFHAHIPGESRGMSVFFRAKALTESWNQPDTGYRFSLNPDGGWRLAAYDGWHMPGDGWSSSNRKGEYEKLATGKAEAGGDASEGRLRLRVEGDKITVWLGEERLVEFEHEGGEIEPVPYGGFGVAWRYESVGWIGDIEVERF